VQQILEGTIYCNCKIVTLTEISTGLIFTLYIQDLIRQGWIIHIHLIVRVKVLIYVLLLFLNVYFIPDRESTNSNGKR